jgi:hypothetical protein
VIRSAFATTAALAVTLALGVSAAAAATQPGTPLTSLAARDGLSLPPSLTQAITNRLGPAPRAAATSQAPAPAPQRELQASDGMSLDLFGWTVSLTADGQTALVGAPGRTIGAAYVFVQRGGKWSEQQELDSPAGAAQDGYGWSVTLAGDGGTALVSAYTGNGLNGIVYSYARQGGSYVLDGRITAPDGAAGDAFGASVSLSGLGNVALIGAPDHNGDQGAAYVFVHGGRSWSEQREFQDPGAAGEAYGYSVSEAADGLTGVVGAPLANGGDGAAYVFSQLGSSQQQLVGTATPATSLFGLSVSIDALTGRILVGSPFANLGEGAAFVYDNAGSRWTQSQELAPSNPGGSDAFGFSVSLDYLGNVALIGATGRNGTAGSAFTFAGNGNGNGKLSQQRELTEPTPGLGDQYGYSVAVNALGSELLIGSPYTNNATGAAWAVAGPIG